MIVLVGSDKPTRAKVDRIADFCQVQTKSFPTAEAFLESGFHEHNVCILAEVQLSGMNGIALQERLREVSLLPVVLLTKEPRTHLIVRAMLNGAVTVLEQPISESELSCAVESSIELHRKRCQRRAAFEEMNSRLERLNDEERAVLELCLSGEKNRTMARRLDVSVRTIEARRKRMLKKTETRSLIELVQLMTTVQYSIQDPLTRTDEFNAYHDVRQLSLSNY